MNFSQFFSFTSNSSAILKVIRIKNIHVKIRKHYIKFKILKFTFTKSTGTLFSSELIMLLSDSAVPLTTICIVKATTTQLLN